jgi:cytoskeletal protein RodZ
MKEHELHFELDAAFALPNHPLLFPMAIPAKPSAEEQKAKDESSFETSINENKHRTVNWNIVAFWGFIILIGAGIMAWGIRYFMNQQKASPTMVEQLENPSAPQTEVTVSNTSALQSTDSTVAAGNLSGNTSDTPSFKFIIKEYKTLAKAEKKQKQLFSYGYNVAVVNKDSSTFYVVNTIKLMPADTAKMKDSLSRMLNPNGVLIMK